MTRRYIVWGDANGFTRLTLLNGNATLATLQAAMLAQSNADWLNTVEAAVVSNGAPAPPGGPYRGVSDCARLVYQDAANNLTSIMLPAPLAAVFMADQETVDATAIAAITAAVVGTVLTPAGGVVTSFVGGTRQPTTRENYG